MSDPKQPPPTKPAPTQMQIPEIIITPPPEEVLNPQLFYEMEQLCPDTCRAIQFRCDCASHHRHAHTEFVPCHKHVFQVPRCDGCYDICLDVQVIEVTDPQPASCGGAYKGCCCMIKPPAGVYLYENGLFCPQLLFVCSEHRWSSHFEMGPDVFWPPDCDADIDEIVGDIWGSASG